MIRCNRSISLSYYFQLDRRTQISAQGLHKALEDKERLHLTIAI